LGKDKESEEKGSRSAEMMGAEGGRMGFQLPNLVDADVEAFKIWVSCSSVCSMRTVSIIRIGVDRLLS
jgi:hypothetical protein